MSDSEDNWGSDAEEEFVDLGSKKAASPKKSATSPKKADASPKKDFSPSKRGASPAAKKDDAGSAKKEEENKVITKRIHSLDDFQVKGMKEVDELVSKFIDLKLNKDWLPGVTPPKEEEKEKDESQSKDKKKEKKADDAVSVAPSVAVSATAAKKKVADLTHCKAKKAHNKVFQTALSMLLGKLDLGAVEKLHADLKRSIATKKKQEEEKAAKKKKNEAMKDELKKQEEERKLKEEAEKKGETYENDEDFFAGMM